MLGISGVEHKRPIIGFLRVSTDKQGRSGLGLEAQEKALHDYAKQQGSRILKTYQEIESVCKLLQRVSNR